MQGGHAMRRRDFIALVGSGVAAWPMSSAAQQPQRVRRLGVLYQGSAKTHPTPTFRTFLSALAEAGWMEGTNLAIDLRFSEGSAEALPQLMNELLALHPDLVVVAPTRPAVVAKQATRTIPIVFAQVADPIGAGIVASLARPEGNITGMSTQAKDLSGKRLELLREMLPTTSRIAVLWNKPSQGAVLVFREFVAASAALAVELKDVGISNRAELQGAFEEAIRSGTTAMQLIDDPVILGYKDQIIRWAAENKMPLFSLSPEFAIGGGLQSYGPKMLEVYRHAARYVDRILRGAKPSELPVEQPTVFELVINLRTAKALGLEVPATLLARADEVIE
jgi:putative ABC transport system substrate-binding protein